MRRIIAIVLGLVMVMAVLTGCATAEPATTETTDDQTTAAATEAPAVETTEATTEEPVELIPLNVGYNPDYCCAWVLATAKDMGYFEDEGFDVTLYQFNNGPEQISAMESGAIDVVSIGTGAHKLAATGSCTIFCFSHLSDAERVMGLVSHGVSELSDLQGKKVGYASGTASETILLTALNSVGLTLDDIEAYDMDTTSLATAMISGSIDACATWSPNDLTIIEAMGDDAKILATSADYSDIYVGPLSFAAEAGFLSENHDMMVAFTRALLKAKDYASVEDNRDEVSQFIATLCGLDYEAIYAQRYDGAFISGEETYEGVLDGTIRGYYELYESSAIENGTIDQTAALSVDEFIDWSFMQEAGESLYK